MRGIGESLGSWSSLSVNKYRISVDEHMKDVKRFVEKVRGLERDDDDGDVAIPKGFMLKDKFYEVSDEQERKLRGLQSTIILSTLLNVIGNDIDFKPDEISYYPLPHRSSLSEPTIHFSQARCVQLNDTLHGHCTPEHRSCFG